MMSSADHANRYQNDGTDHRGTRGPYAPRSFASMRGAGARQASRARAMRFCCSDTTRQFVCGSYGGVRHHPEVYLEAYSEGMLLMIALPLCRFKVMRRHNRRARACDYVCRALTQPDPFAMVVTARGKDGKSSEASACPLGQHQQAQSESAAVANSRHKCESRPN